MKNDFIQMQHNESKSRSCEMHAPTILLYVAKKFIVYTCAHNRCHWEYVHIQTFGHAKVCHRTCTLYAKTEQLTISVSTIFFWQCRAIIIFQGYGARCTHGTPFI